MLPRSANFWSAIAVVAFAASPVRADDVKKIDFAHDIAPLLKARCAECHTNGKYKGGLSLDTRADAIKSGIAPGKSAGSEILKRVTSNDPDLRMPPKGDRLTAKEIERLRQWIDQGLPWEAGFTFKVTGYVAPLKPRRPELPPSRPGLEHPLDRLLDAYATRQKVELTAPADDVAFLRRAYLDIIGLLPTPAETSAFLADPAADKRKLLIRRLLDDRRGYAEHWLTFWNDMLRNDYAGPGYIDGGRKQISAWLYKALLENKPYDQFTRELINPTPESEGFIKGIRWRGNVNASQVQELQFSQNVSQVFFGINMKCASCHDSFIDSWKLTDAYSLAAVMSDRPLEIHRCDKKTGTFATARFVWPELGDIDPKAPRAKRLEQLAQLVTHADNGRFTRTIANRFWQRLLGRGIVHPVDIMGNRPWSDDVLDYLAVYLQDNNYDLQKLLEHIMTSRAYQSRPVRLEKEPAGDDYVFRGPEVRRLSAEQFLDAVWMMTKTAPGAGAAPVAAPPYPETTPPERRFVRAALVNADGLMRSLGRPPREQVVTTRPDQLTTLQAMDLSNGPVLAATLARGADAVLKANSKRSPEELIDDVYRRALCRPPAPEEAAAARELMGAQASVEGVADLLWAVYMLPEFQLIR
jgi:mono/diheme cytochrome c family protein